MEDFVKWVESRLEGFNNLSDEEQGREARNFLIILRGRTVWVSGELGGESFIAPACIAMAYIAVNIKTKRPSLYLNTDLVRIFGYVVRSFKVGLYFDDEEPTPCWEGALVLEGFVDETIDTLLQTGGGENQGEGSFVIDLPVGVEWDG